jgi:nuclear-control-of-ATPase protein 2
LFARKADHNFSQIRRIDGQLDRLQLSTATAAAEDWETFSISDVSTRDAKKLLRITELQSLIKSLSTTASSASPLSSKDKILYVLNDAKVTSLDPSYEHELEWLLVSKAAVQAYGVVLNTILEQTLQVNDHIWYWDDILSSRRHAGLYSLQTSPIRMWQWAKDIISDVRTRRTDGITAGWRQFYALVQESVRHRSLATMQRRVVSPLARVRNEASKNQKRLKQLREINANALGVILGEGLSNESIHEEGISTPSEVRAALDDQHKWKSTITKSIALMDAVLSHVQDPEADVENFDANIESSRRVDRLYVLADNGGAATAEDLNPAEVATRIQNLLQNALPQYTSTFSERLDYSGRPSRLIRYWLPATALLLSSSTLLRIAVNRKAEIIEWIQGFGQTCIDFWQNWVVEPIERVIGTIRHDEGSEVAIMSKGSLEGDRNSLERMVVEFARDENGSLSEAELNDIKSKVHNGDLTPILKAYERDMAKPFVGAIRGNLIRALLVQIQKTKVDVEVAMGGIDSLLKQQELLFGLLGITPGVLITFGVVRYLNSVFGSRKGLQQGQTQDQILCVLR